MNNDRFRNFERWSKYKRKEYSLDGFLNEQDFLGESLISIKINDRYLDMLVRVNKTSPIVVLFHGAMPRPEGFKLPVFSGLNIVEESYSRILISDSCLQESDLLTLGWFCGSQRIPLQKILPIVLNKIFEIANPSRKIFAGGSGGGFASLFYSSFFKNSFVFASNPQTNILHYYKAHVDRYAYHAWGCSHEELTGKIIVDLNQLDYISNTVFYVQNNTDSFHIKNHCAGFLNSIGCDGTRLFEDQILDSRFFYKSLYWGDGHVGPTAVFWKRIINFFGEYPFDKDLIFKDDVFYNFVHESYCLHLSDLLESSSKFSDLNELSKAHKILDRYFKSVSKPDPKALMLAMDIAFKENDLDKARRIGFEALKCYPHGWAIQYHYAVILSKLHLPEEAAFTLIAIQERLGNRTPVPVIEFIEKLKTNN